MRLGKLQLFSSYCPAILFYSAFVDISCFQAEGTALTGLKCIFIYNHTSLESVGLVQQFWTSGLMKTEPESLYD
jgi:hypothetical protein